MSGPLRAFACLVIALLLALPAEAAGKRVAMVVGNAAYQNAPALSNTVNDARAVAAAFERLGFTVLTAFDASQAELIRTLATFSTDLKDADAGVFYYAGHGIQVGNENFILPVDIKVENELSIRYGGLNLSDVLADLERLPKAAIVILDACRDNPFAAQLASAEGRSIGQSRGLAPVALKGDGTLIAFAAAPGAVASDGAGEHSPYTAALLAELEQPGVEAALMFRRVAGRVIAATAGEQRPELLVRLVSEFYFAGVAALPAPVEVAAPATPLVAAPVDAAPVQLVAEDRQAVDRHDGRAALWGYDATLIDSPLDAPRDAWVAPGGQQVAEAAEPNSSFGSAQPVGPNDAVRLSLAPQGDNDWLRISVGQAGRLHVGAASPPAAITLDLRVANANGDELLYWTPAPRPGGALDVDVDLPKPGVYLLQFADANTSASSPDGFEVALSLTPATDLYEPDDRVDLAKHLPLDGTTPIAMFPKADVDWFKFVAPRPGSLVIGLTDAPESVATSLRVSNADGGELLYWQPAPRPGGDNLAVVDLPRPGVYYLQVADANSASADPRPVTLTTHFAPSPDEYEPDDSFGTAMPVASSGDNTIAIFPKGDSDFLEVAFDQPGELTLEAKGPPQNLNLSWRMLDSSGTEVQYWQPASRPGGDLYGTYDVAKPGRYFIQLGEQNNAAGSVGPIDLRLDFRASLDAFEPNDTLGSAKPLTLGGQVQLTMLPKGDNDWFRVTVDQPGELAVSIDEQAQNLALSFRVVAPDWTELLYWVPAYRKGGLTQGFADLPRAGTYYLQIADADTGQRSIEPATLKTTFTPTLNSNEPNNSFGEATPVEIDGVTEAQILPRGDTDWHVFHAPGPGTLDVAVTGVPENLDIAFHLLNADKAEIQYWVVPPRKGGDTVGSVSIPAAGWYWMELADANNDDRSPRSFTVTRTFKPAG